MTHWIGPLGPAFILGFAVLGGLCVGSFLNVVIHRLPAQVLGGAEAPGLAQPDSHCPHCRTPLASWHLVPVLSWLWLRGRCAFCAAPISARYPLVEAANALLWLLCAFHWPAPLTALAWALFASALLALALIDWQTTLLPDALTQPLLWAGLVGALLDLTGQPLTQAVWGAVVGYLSLWSVAALFARLTGKVGLGDGDIKLLAALGAWLGPLALLPLVLGASIAGVVVGLCLQRTAKLRAGGYLPFGPFLAVAGLVLAFAGADATRWLLGT